ncbi:flagellar FlbD family protein [Jonesia quinghaiensis]|uniref:flagellar FlbD family protein n=1 Tax=Jonesia quinghaiensis TaxID=262806 RepID=UPI00042715E2|nr:flagellar FlbD family protein [Jonesia quinghaiensis]
MVIVTRLNGERFALNPDLVQRIDSVPDTILTLVDGTKYIVRESMAEVIELINEQRAGIIARAQNLVPDVEYVQPDLTLVTPIAEEDK